MSLIPRNPSTIIQKAHERGDLDRNSDSIYAQECRAAEWSRASGLYIIWAPHPSSTIPVSATDDIRNGSGQCCRIGESSLCRCGHELGSHSVVDVITKVAKYKGRNPGYLKPPPCKQGGCKCKEYTYVPCYPEECGQWWVKRRRDFDLMEWRKRVRMNPHDYACIGCNLKVSDHETLIETRDQRISRHPEAKVDDAYIPLHEYRAAYHRSDDGGIELTSEARQELSYSVPRNAPQRQRK